MMSDMSGIMDDLRDVMDRCAPKWPQEHGEDRLKSLGDIVLAWRSMRGITQEQVHQAGGPSDVTIRGLEVHSPKRPSRSTLSRLDMGLGWPVGTSQGIVDGDLDMTPPHGGPTPEQAQERVVSLCVELMSLVPLMRDGKADDISPRLLSVAHGILDLSSSLGAGE